MAIDPDGDRVIVAFRAPARLMAFAQDGSTQFNLPNCGAADDYSSMPSVIGSMSAAAKAWSTCSSGAARATSPIARVPTASGARTSLFRAEADRLLVAARSSGREPAAARVFRPTL